MARFTLLPAPWDNDVDDERRRNRAIAVGLVISILIHAALLFIVLPKPPDDPSTQPSAQGPLAINLSDVKQPPAQTPPSEPQEAAQPQRTPPVVQPRAPPVIATRRPTPVTPFVVPQAKPTPVPTPPKAPDPTPEAQPAPPGDMMSQIAANRARREAQEADARASNPASGGGGGGADPAMAAINRNLATLNRGNSFDKSGIGGVFQLGTVGYNQAEFSFRGWNAHFNNGWSETIRVDRGSNPSIQIAVIRRMIELIRQHEQGDFVWESRRLDREVTLSARPGDQAGLEDFMMKEFFSDDRRAKQ
ncbi:hypothetical protein BH10PSE17_BH10PSE17_10640 [soil metagenome]